MTNIKTKAELLTAMRAYRACADATKYVRATPDDATAHEIWLGCDHADWLTWFGTRHRPAAMRAFAFACADRAVRVYAPEALARAGLGGEGATLRALAPIVDAGTARVGAGAARAAAHAADSVAADSVDDDAYDARAAARAAADAADASYCSDSYADIRTADAAYYAGVLAYATYVVELRIQLDALHALADAVLVG